jgi:aminoglycoside 6'-N-acetyltransferase
VLEGAIVRLRPATKDDIGELARIRNTDEVRARWRGEDMEAELATDLDDDTIHPYVIEFEGRTVGWIQWGEEDEPDYRHASLDIFVDPRVHGRGIGTDAVRTLSRHLFREEGHHRLVIDPAADNSAAIMCYGKVGFRPVGVMRQYERDADGTWHDNLLMDLLASEFEDG